MNPVLAFTSCTNSRSSDVQNLIGIHKTEIEGDVDSHSDKPRLSQESVSSSICKKRKGDDETRDDTNNQSAIRDLFITALRKSLITCNSKNEDACSLDIGYPTEFKHVYHVTFDRFQGFLGLPVEFLHEIEKKAPSASANVFGVSVKSLQCSYDGRGNSVPTILLMMQNTLYMKGGLKAEGIFRINADNRDEEHAREELNNGIVPEEIDVHSLASLIKAWFRELPSGILDTVQPRQLSTCKTEDDYSEIAQNLPLTEAALLDWAINLMADVSELEHHNKMNAHNIATVFAPNMSQIADPLNALYHAVQVMNMLKTLVIKAVREREELRIKVLTHSPRFVVRNNSVKHCLSQMVDFCGEKDGQSVQGNSNGGESYAISTHIPTLCKMSDLEGGGSKTEWQSFRKGIRRLCRSTVDSKAVKKVQDIATVN